MSSEQYLFQVREILNGQLSIIQRLGQESRDVPDSQQRKSLADRARDEMNSLYDRAFRTQVPAEFRELHLFLTKGIVYSVASLDSLGRAYEYHPSSPMHAEALLKEATVLAGYSKDMKDRVIMLMRNATGEPVSTTTATKTESGAAPESDVTVGDFSYAVKSVRKADTIGVPALGFGAKARGVFLIVEFTMENIGKQTHYVTSDMILLQDLRGNTYRGSFESIYLANGLLIEQLNPRLQATFTLTFDVPKDIGRANLRVSADILSVRYKLIDLGVV